MKELFFKLDSYSFSNKINNLQKYLKENEIEFSINNNIIEFYIYINSQRIWCEGSIYKDRINNFVFSSKCSLKEESDNLKALISRCYPKKYLTDDLNVTYYETYPQNGYLLNLTLSNSFDFYLIVRFEDEKNKPFKSLTRSKDKFDIIFVIISSIIGLALTILFIYLYNNKNDLYMNIITAGISFMYMAICIFILLASELGIGRSLLYSIIASIIYVVIIFIVIFLFSIFNNVSFSLGLLIDSLMWSIYSMPSFILVIGIIVLLMILG